MQAGEALLGNLRDFTVGIVQQRREHRHGGRRADLGQAPEGGDANRLFAFPGGIGQRRQGLGVSASAQRLNQEDLAVRRWLLEFTGQGERDLRAGQFVRDAGGSGEEGKVVAVQGLNQQGQTGLASAENGAAPGGGANLVGSLEGAQTIIDGSGSPGVAPGPKSLRATEQALAEGELVGRGRLREGVLEGAGGVGCGDFAQGPRGGLGHVRVGIVEQAGERSHGGGIVPDANAAYDSHQGLSVEPAQRVPQRAVHRAVGDGLQAIAGHVRQFLIAQERSQGSDGILGSDTSQLAAGVGLVFPGRIGL